MIDTYPNEVQGKDHDQQNTLSFVKDAKMLLTEVAELWEAVSENKANVSTMSGSREGGSRVEEFVAELLQAMTKSRDYRVDNEQKTRPAEIELPFVKHREKPFDETAAAANKELFGAREESAALRKSRDECLSKLKELENDFERSLKALFGQTKELLDNV